MSHPSRERRAQQAATKQYGVSILLSGSLVALMSDEVRLLCRKIDRVTVKGSVEVCLCVSVCVCVLLGGSAIHNVMVDVGRGMSQPIELYTYDVPIIEATTIEEVKEESDVSFFEQFSPRTSAQV